MRYRLRTLLIVLSLAGIVCAAVGWSWRRNAAEQESLKILIAHHAQYDYDNGAWWGLGPEVGFVYMVGSEATDPEVLSALRRLPGLQSVIVDTEQAETMLKYELQDRAVEVRAVLPR